jgi:hypothetical protein
MSESQEIQMPWIPGAKTGKNVSWADPGLQKHDSGWSTTVKAGRPFPLVANKRKEATYGSPSDDQRWSREDLVAKAQPEKLVLRQNHQADAPGKNATWFLTFTQGKPNRARKGQHNSRNERLVAFEINGAPGL